jgi:hypothetical protein
MRVFEEQQRRMEGQIPQSPVTFGTVEAVDADNRLLKLIIEPWGTETGWCKCLKDTFYPIPIHAPHMDPDAPVDPDTDQHLFKHDDHNPQFPYKVGQEVLAAAVQGSHGSEQYVVLGLIDMGPVSEQ